jgi:PHD/YefM family antitoxin component YafN of YafNO toxin-antitoxin module
MRPSTSVRITTVSAFKKQLASMDVSEPVIVTQNGEPIYVVQDPVQFELQQEQIALMRLLSFAEKAVKAGRMVSSSGLRDGLRSLVSSDANDKSG